MARIDDLRDFLTAAAENAEGSRVRIVQNSDGSIDGEILIPVERGESLEAALESVEAEMTARPRGVYYSTGFRWEPRPVDSPNLYDRYRGLFQLFSHYYGALPESVALTETILDGMRRKRYRKPIQAIVRIHWNRHGTRPPRESK